MHSALLFASGFTEVRPGLIFWTLVTFVIVAFVLRRAAWGPILDVVQNREKSISDSISAAKRERAEAEKLLGEQKAAITEARREAAEMMRKNAEDVERLRTELVSKARAEADAQRAEATRAIQEEKQKAIAEVKGIAADLAIQIAEKLIGEKMDDQRQRALADQYVKQLTTKADVAPPAA